MMKTKICDLVIILNKVTFSNSLRYCTYNGIQNFYVFTIIRIHKENNRKQVLIRHNCFYVLSLIQNGKSTSGK